MMFRWFWSLALLLPLSLAHAADDIDRLMAALAGNAGGTVRFVERRHLAILDAPLESRGEMTYRAPDWLERRTLTPRPERLLLDKDTLTLERDKRRVSLPVNQRPEVEAFVASVRSTLQGDRAALQRHYSLQLQRQQQRWTLTLRPLESRLRNVISRIDIAGAGATVDTIEYLQTDGDRTEVWLEPVSKP